MPMPESTDPRLDTDVWFWSCGWCCSWSRGCPSDWKEASFRFLHESVPKVKDPAAAAAAASDVLLLVIIVAVIVTVFVSRVPRM